MARINCGEVLMWGNIVTWANYVKLMLVAIALKQSILIRRNDLLISASVLGVRWKRLMDLLALVGGWWAHYGPGPFWLHGLRWCHRPCWWHVDFSDRLLCFVTVAHKAVDSCGYEAKQYNWHPDKPVT